MGIGRDTLYFRYNNYIVKAIDGSEEMCKNAKIYLSDFFDDVEIECIKFEDFKEINEYDGIWACASLLHVKKENLKDVLINIRNALKDNGILYASFKDGNNEIIDEYGRYYNNIDKDKFIDLSNEVNLQTIDYMSNETEETKWNNFILRKRC